jgi:hypothetical protein
MSNVGNGRFQDSAQGLQNIAAIVNNQVGYFVSNNYDPNDPASFFCPVSFSWISTGQSVTVVPVGPNALRIGVVPNPPIAVSQTVKVYFNKPGGGYVVGKF